MKKFAGLFLCLLLVCLCAFALAEDVAIDSVNFPDSVFRELVKPFDTNNDDKLDYAEINCARELIVSYQSIADLTGVEHLTGLELLQCDNNLLQSLDLSHNTKLIWLSCGHNQLKTLDVSMCPDLEEVNCSGNQLQTLNVRGNTALEHLMCEENQLQTLDLSTNVKLNYFRCYSNRFQSLDVSQNAAITILDCHDNQLQALDVTHNPALITLNCYTNSLNELDLSQNPELQYLTCQGNALHELDLSSNTKIKCLKCFSNQLKTLDVSKCAVLNTLVTEGTPGDHQEVGAYGWWTDDMYGYPKDYLFVDKSVTIITDKGSYGGNDQTPVSSITLNKTKVSLTRTSKKTKPTLQLKATVSPANATDPSVEWTSSNKKIATVDENGKVTALKAGKVTITCTAKDGSGVSATCIVSVKDKQVKKITLNKKSVTLKKGKTFQLEVKTITPKDAVNQNVKWTTSNKKVATVDSKGKVTAKKKGTCYITCTAKDGSKVTVKCKITVK